MKCLEAGGLETRWDVDANRADARRDGNRYNLYEMSAHNKLYFYDHPREYNNKLIKVLVNYGYFFLPICGYKFKILMMLREPEAIRRSYKRFFGHDIAYGEGPDAKPLTDKIYFDLMNNAIREAKTRKDIEIDVINGRGVVENPLAKFIQLQQAGWPIEPWYAANVVETKH